MGRGYRNIPNWLEFDSNQENDKSFHIYTIFTKCYPVWVIFPKWLIHVSQIGQKLRCGIKMHQMGKTSHLVKNVEKYLPNGVPIW